MGRSVSYPCNSAVVAYSAINCTDPDDMGDDFDWLVEGYQDDLKEAFKSLSACKKWVGDEDRAVMENRFAYFGVSEYCGLVAMWVLPKDDYDINPGLRDKWIDSISTKFTKVAAGCFGQALYKQGTFSNGEGLFQPISGKQQGSMGLGFSSKEGWL